MKRECQCPKCKRIMILDGDSFICQYCEIGFKANPPKNCEHNNITFGVANYAICDDCGMRLLYE